ncbi:hypothetical protein [Streptomyces sp. NPDC057877]|uniref:hypothetical protein n=1 Tax=Streptomyces sp. NPDC057877 TaxID=3346269 RepID=UPI003695BF35
MGASRWRMAGIAGLVVVTVGGLVACEPGQLSSATVAFTTDELMTREMERRDTGVQWLSCTANFGDGNGSSPSASEDTVADVDCQGRTDDGKEITVEGRVTRAVDGACVRGELTAKIDGREWFRVDGLGNCDAKPSTPPAGNPGGGQQPGPTVTVTVTRTVYCERAPQCWPDGK